MKSVAVADAWSLEPIGELRLGERVFPVPPLTFARFQRLLGIDHAAIVAAMTGGGLAGAWPAVEACVPGVPRDLWEEEAMPPDVASLFLVFVKGHDWAFISDAIRFGEPPEPGEKPSTRAEVVGGLIAIARATGYTIEALNAMRVEGFYMLVEALRAEKERNANPEGEGMPGGIEVADGDATGLLARLNEAVGASRGE